MHNQTVPPIVATAAAGETHTGSEANAFTVRAVEGESEDLTVDLSADPVMGMGGSFEGDTFVDVRNLVGGNGVNTFTGNAEANQFTGGTAADVFNGGGGNDTLGGGAGNDILYGVAGSDILNGGAGNDIIVVIGTNGTANSYTAADLTIAAERLSSRTSDLNLATLGLTVALINSAANAPSDVAAGERIDGGEGMDDLIVYGDVDMSTRGTSIANVSTVVLNSSIRMKADQLTGLSFKGAGANSALIIASGNADFSDISDIDDVATIRVEAGATLTVAMAEIAAEIREANDTIALEGAGTLAFEEDIVGGGLAGVSIADTLTTTDNGTPLDGNETIVGALATATVETHTGNEANAFIVRAAEGESAPLTVNLSADPVMGTGGSFNDDTFMNIRNLIGGNGVNTFTGNAEANSFTGGAAADVFNGGGGDDILYGKAGADTLNGEAGNDVIVVIGTNGVANSYMGADLTIAAERLSSRSSDLNLAALGLTVALINSAVDAPSDVAAGESIDGGTGMDDLIVYGNVDMSTTGTSIANISTIVLNSSIRMKADQLTGLSFKGAGDSTLIIASGNADFSDISDIDGVVTIRIESGATLTVAMAEIAEFTETNDAIALEGAGTLAFEEDIPAGGLVGVSIAGTLTITDNGDALDGDEMATANDDSYTATVNSDTFILSAGADTATGFTSLSTAAGVHHDRISFSGFATTNIAGISFTAPNANSIQLSGYGAAGDTFTFPHANIAGVSNAVDFHTAIAATRTGAERFFTGLVYTGQGTDSANTLTGTTGNDTFYGFGGDDTFTATTGTDTYYGGDGSNTLSFAGQTTEIYVNLDTINYYLVSPALTLSTTAPGTLLPKTDTDSNISTGSITNRMGSSVDGTVNIRNIDNLIGGRNQDILIGNRENNELHNGINNTGIQDVLRGNGGADTFVLSNSGSVASEMNISDFNVTEMDMLDLSEFEGITVEDLSAQATPSFFVSPTHLFVSFNVSGELFPVIYFQNLLINASNTVADTYESIKGNIIFAE